MPETTRLDLPKQGDPAAKRELQQITDISLKNDTFKSLNLDDIKQMGRSILSEVGIYDVIRQECHDDFFYFIDTVLNKICGLDEKTGVRKFEYSRARHFRWMKYLIDGVYPPQAVFNDMYRFRSSKDAPHPFHVCTKNSWHNKKLMLLPRNHGKSRVGNIAYNMWRLYNNPNMRILILSETRQNAVDMLFMIKDLYVKIRDAKNGENFIAYHVMGDWVGDQWNEDAIRVKTRTVSETVPTIATAGMESEITSKHFDLICCDDVVGEQNVTTPEQIEKHKGKISRLTEVGDYDRSSVTDYIFFGTRWHYSDYYSVILDELTDIYDILKLACWDEGTHEPLFGEKYTKEMLETIRMEKLTSPHPEEWSNQWLNEPQDVENAIFKRSDLQFYEEAPKGLFVGVFVDASWSENRWSDYIAIVPVGIGNYNSRYVFPYWYGKEDNPFVVAKKLISICAPFYNDRILRLVGVEDGPAYKALLPIIGDMAPWIRLQPMKPENRSKDGRILGLAGLTVNKRLFIRKNMHELIEQLLRFPRYSRRDLADALAYHLDWQPISSQIPLHKEPPFPTNRERWIRQCKMDDERAQARRL